MQPQSPSPQGPPPGGGAPGGAPGADPNAQGGGADQGAQLQQLGQQYVAQGRPPELAQQIADAVVGLMGLDQQGGGQGPAAGAGPPGGGGMEGGGAPGGAPAGPPTMRKGGKFESKAAKAQRLGQQPQAPTGMPKIKIPGAK